MRYSSFTETGSICLNIYLTNIFAKALSIGLDIIICPAALLRKTLIIIWTITALSVEYSCLWCYVFYHGCIIRILLAFSDDWSFSKLRYPSIFRLVNFSNKCIIRSLLTFYVFKASIRLYMSSDWKMWSWLNAIIRYMLVTDMFSFFKVFITLIR